MTAVKEYVVTLYNRNDLEEFYKDMEILRPTAYDCMPERTVDCANRRSTSRNTHYWMTEDEVVILRQDPRVKAAELTPAELGLVIRKNWTQSSTVWNKSTTTNAAHVNWGLLRCTEETQRANWGSDSVQNQTATVTVKEQGRNVDVVIVDGHINPAHSEYAVNSDGTGGSRVVQYNWFQHSVSVEGSVKNSYVYEPYVDVAPTGQTFVFQNPGFAYTITGFGGTNPAITLVRGVTYTFDFQSFTSGHPIALRLSNGNTSAVPGTAGNNPSGGVWGSSATVTYAVPLDAPNSIVYQCVFHSSMIGTVNIVDNTFDPDRTDDNNHGAHVAGTACGNTQGWARSASIYNINPYSTNINELGELALFDYIREFHKTKSINPITGRKNPTVMNHSWGYGYEFNLSTNPVSSINFRGAVINGPFTQTQLREYGIYASGGILFAPAEYPALDADVEDAIADGIIMIGAASNDYTKIDVLGGADYNNFFTTNLGSAFYHRGSSPGKAGNSICVGSVDVLSTEYKATYSNNGPRVDIYAPGTRIISSTNSGGVSDPRGLFLNKKSGTSMASPQVCGVVACLLEQNPHWNQIQVRNFLIGTSKQSQLTDTGGNLSDYTALQGSANSYLYIRKERPDTGQTLPKLNQGVRPTVGMTYPRNKIVRYN